MSDQPRFSNAISNIDINSYRAYKNLLKTGKISTPDRTPNSKNNNQVGNYTKINNENMMNSQVKNLTKYVFSSQSKRFEWQTNEAINRHSELNGSITNLRHKHLNSEKWQGLNVSQDGRNEQNYDKYKNFHKLGTRNLQSAITSEYSAKENQITERNRKRSSEANNKQLTRSSSMNDIIQKTPENNLPVKKYSHLLHPKTDIFHINYVDDNRGGRKNVSIDDIRYDGNYCGKRNKEINEVHFINVYKDKNIFRNYLNPSINMKSEGASTHMKMDKPRLNKYSSKASTDFQSISTNNRGDK